MADSNSSHRLLSALFTGILFGLGLSVSQMIDPAKVISFLDLAGYWDPSLAFVMGGALFVNYFATRSILKRQTPVFSDTFRLPSKSEIDKKLILGSALFGVGWGIAGYCPGPAIVSISFINIDVLLLVISYVIGTVVGIQIDNRWKTVI